MATVRELVAKLGFDVDMKPLRDFDNSIAKVRNNVKQGLGSSNLKGFFSNILGGFSNAPIGPALNRFRKRFQKRFQKTAEILRKSARAAMTGVAAAATGAIASGKGFANKEQLQTRLKFQLEKSGTSFKEVEGAMESVRKKTGMLISEQEMLNAATESFSIDQNMEAFLSTLEPAVKLSRVFGKNLNEVTTAFANFRASGDTSALKELGFFTAQQLEAFKKAGTDPSEQGILNRTNQITQKVAQSTSLINKHFDKYQNTSTATFKKVESGFTSLKNSIGEGVFNVLGKVYNFAESINKSQNEKRGGFTPETQRTMLNRATTNNSTTNSSSNHVNNNTVFNNTITVNESPDGKQSAANISEQMKSSMRQSQQTKPAIGKNQVR